MKMKRAWWFILALTLGTGLGLVVLALPGDQAQAENPIRMDAAPAGFDLSSKDDPSEGTSKRVVNLDGSSVAESTGFACYDADSVQNLCFAVYNGSTNFEWIESVRLTFPDPPSLSPWDASCLAGGQDPTDSTGYAVNYNCDDSVTNEIFYEDSDADTWGEISVGSSWGTCVQVTIPSGYTGPRYVTWELVGDAGSRTSGQVELTPCTPLMLVPDEIELEGCNGLAQTIELKLWNHSAGNNVTIDFSYPSHSPGLAPSAIPSTQMSNGGIMTFTAQLEPDRCLATNETVTARLRAEASSSGSDETLITQTITSLSGWQRREDSPVLSVDSVVVWAAQEDGRLWSIGGFGANGAVQSYDPTNGKWLTHTAQVSPRIEYPSDGCYGLDATGDEVVVLFPDTVTTDTLHIYNITDDSWSTATVPDFFPPEGRWAHDIVSLQSIPSQHMKATEPNACYLSGGAEQPGGGTTRDLWVYYPDGRPGRHLDKFYDPNTVFDFHASWYVPWIGDQGAICVAGGTDFNSQIIANSQCYDIATESLNAVNANLGSLPEPWWGMADGWQIQQGEYQIWLANGVAQNGTLLPASAYASASRGFTYGPQLPLALYRLEGSGWQESFYTFNGAYAGLAGTRTNFLLAQCPWCAEINLPLVLRDFN